MIRYRTSRNGDAPALAVLWNRALLGRNAVGPLSAHEFDTLALGKLGFDRCGLIVAERDGRIVGFAHAGFGPNDPETSVRRLDTSMGTVALLLTDPGIDDPELERGLFQHAEAYLRSRGAQVIYCGGQYPLNPFYWGLYGGSEFSGVLESHGALNRAALRAGYEPAAVSLLLEADLTAPEHRDPKLVMLRRQYRVEVDEDALPFTWWDALAIGLFHPTRFDLMDRQDGHRVGRAWTWDIASGVAIGDGRSRTGLIRVEIDPTHRERGLGSLLVLECMKVARAVRADVLCVQTSETNLPALALYDSLGFVRVEKATLYRLPAALLDRSREIEPLNGPV